jgi:hypothetical protein
VLSSLTEGIAAIGGLHPGEKEAPVPLPTIMGAGGTGLRPVTLSLSPSKHDGSRSYFKMPEIVPCAVFSAPCTVFEPDRAD